METTLSSQPQSVPEIPGYELLERIGEGGMGEVYRAIQCSLRRTVAIKLLHQPPGSRSVSEAHLLASLNHPNVVTIFDNGQVAGRPYLVLEYVAGTNLRALLDAGKPWPPAEAVPILDAIARALTYIHSRSILHLDLKPENVLCDFRREVKITDFGLASADLGGKTLTDLGQAQGTIDYSSPEQRFGLSVDHRSDLFSLATLSYELLTGRLPGRVYVPASRFNPQLSRAVDAVLRKALSRDPDERPATVEELRQELVRGLTRRNLSRRLFLIAACGLIGAAVLALVLLRYYR